MLGKDHSDSRCEDQYQMTDSLYESIVDYIKNKGINLQTFCDEVRLPYYLVSKVMDRNIKMFCYRPALVKMATHIDAYKNASEFEKIQPKIIKY